ncbi:proline--tRNA ligase [Kocuria rhizophila]|uniref:Proline--tRNA ligase n=1 Tax=Kocuria rhizophila (strain ATCC 9341 / DSM 348 / NBRC 103217 / DC2201) TaxID=378753 RepID=SYP_KOCRD|nr:proline--tRNA ligase [Kocuria rhizophila]B2GKS1.1 RecName: Full=Proline--tRNA ligase; AltName: Full=Prolyl-tRNA synthetase; Short=ProRS [Kocuria rhizophila DC2201]ASE12234.1 proline--tRNA ligase [Kocuria rhizophila]BAG29957.1 prolyl-tRNA synthetase [Kocuria rhizophila DC2201]VEH74769.1 Proline--tRNA ligase [Kocuria rhizophila]
MPLRLSSLFLRTLREDPVDADVDSHKLLVRAGYIRRAAPGIYTWLPLGLAVLRRVEGIVREEMDAIGAQEVHFPALLPREPYEASNRWTEYGENLFRLQDRKGADYLLAPTHEEMFTLLVKDMYSSYKDLPVMLYQIQTKYRDEARPRAGLLRGREFIMKDSYSFDVDDAGLDDAYAKHRAAYVRIFERLGLPVVAVSATSGAMGGSRSEEFMHPSVVGEDTFVRSAGGYAANVEAVTTVVPEPVDCTDAPAAQVHRTPDSPTIDTLVSRSNELHPREGQPWTAADTLKNVLLSVSLPEGGTQLVAVGVPGDREIDLKRVEAGIGGALGIGGELEVEAASEEQLRAVPELVKGYIGPGLSREDALLGTESPTGIPYFVDPRVVPGTRWITGANVAEAHVYDLVAERDFTWDATLEACTVREGDPAPDGSGPLEIARGMEMGHVFQLGRKYAEALGLKVLDNNGKLVTVTMGSYGIGVTRALAAVAEFYHDEHGLLWPRNLSPADVHVVATGKGPEVLEAAEEIVAHLEAAGVSVLFDDRPKVSPGVKFRDAELLGVPTVLVVGRGLADGVLELKDRRSGTSRDIARDRVVAEITAELQGQEGPAAE